MKAQRCCAVEPSVRTALEEELKGQLMDIPNEDSLKKNSKVLYTLSHPLRLKMALLLLKRDHCVCELVQLTKKKRNLVSHHLAIMREGNIVKSYMKSKWKYYQLNESAVHVLKEIERAIVPQRLALL